MESLSLPSASRNEHLLITTDSSGSPFWSYTSDTALSGFICEINLSEFVVGDVDMNGKITADDAREVLRFSAGLSRNVNTEMIGNVDSDTAVTAGDARLLLRAAAGLENWKSWEKIILNLNDSII